VAGATPTGAGESVRIPLVGSPAESLYFAWLGRPEGTVAPACWARRDTVAVFGGSASASESSRRGPNSTSRSSSSVRPTRPVRWCRRTRLVLGAVEEGRDAAAGFHQGVAIGVHAVDTGTAPAASRARPRLTPEGAYEITLADHRVVNTDPIEPYDYAGVESDLAH